MSTKIFFIITVLFTNLFSTPLWAHTGYHNEIHHPLIGVDHFIVILIIGLVTSFISYYFFRK